MAAFPTSSVSGNIYVVLKKPTRTTVLVTGALSFSVVDADNYDNSTHSLLLGAEHFGNPHYTPIVTGAGQSVHQASSSVSTVAGNYISLGAETFAGTYASGLSIDAAFVQDTTPGPTLKRDSFFCWWSGAIAAGLVTGNLVAKFRARDVIGFGPAAPTAI